MPRFKYTLGDAASFLDAFAAAVQRFEGYYPPGTPGFPNGSLSYRNNNPGNLRPTNSTQAQSGGYRVFPTEADGLAALHSDLQTKINRGWNLTQLENVYAPAADNNDPTTYANTVARWLGIDASVPLIQYQAPASSAPAVPGLAPAAALPADPGLESAVNAWATQTAADINSAALDATLPALGLDVGAGDVSNDSGVPVSSGGSGVSALGAVLLALAVGYALS